ncbi:hypothetical protein ABGB18_01535 [Nonomuraea sp. B12E4]|uniref:hypothetical protein n=1 Tax=Nonomuraea sp. B12E4 TaxID=3153564 RepID=UPI00325E95C8
MAAVPDVPAAVRQAEVRRITGLSGLPGALCSNHTGQTWRFRAVITCGWAPDVVGEWVTIGPGRTGQSQGVCGRLGTGVGAVGVDERRV